MVKPEDIIKLINQCREDILALGQVGLPGDQYQGFKNLVCERFGERGLRRDVERLFAQRGDNAPQTTSR